MTEINIEKRSSPWPWILGVLALALVAWVAIEAMRDNEPDTQYSAVITEEQPESTPGTAGTTGTAPGAVDDYSAFAAEADGLTPGRDHEYTAEGIRRLTAALGAVVERNGDQENRDRFERFRQSADRLERDPSSAQHAGTVRDVFTSAVDVLESARLEAGDVSELRQIATSISADEPLLDQTEAVKRFFSQSAEALSRAVR